MASFSDTATAEIRCKAQVAAGTWLTAFVGRNFSGAVICRFQRFMSPTNPDHGAWVETTEDDVD